MKIPGKHNNQRQIEQAIDRTIRREDLSLSRADNDKEQTICNTHRKVNGARGMILNRERAVEGNLLRRRSRLAALRAHLTALRSVPYRKPPKEWDRTGREAVDRVEQSAKEEAKGRQEGKGFLFRAPSYGEPTI